MWIWHLLLVFLLPSAMKKIKGFSVWGWISAYIIQIDCFDQTRLTHESGFLNLVRRFMSFWSPISSLKRTVAQSLTADWSVDPSSSVMKSFYPFCFSFTEFGSVADPDDAWMDLELLNFKVYFLIWCIQTISFAFHVKLIQINLVTLWSQ